MSHAESDAGRAEAFGWVPDGAREPAPLGPAAGLADVDRLAAATTAAGVRVDVRWRGERRPMPADIDLSAFRVIQESVTNVVRHAATTSCTVTVEYRDEEILIETEDAGRGRVASAPGPGMSNGPGTGSGPGLGNGPGMSSGPGLGSGRGYGLVGMGERVALLRGEFSAAARPRGGFRVTARLPLPATAGVR